MTWTIGRIYNFMHHCDCEFHDAIVYMYKDLLEYVSVRACVFLCKGVFLCERCYVGLHLLLCGYECVFVLMCFCMLAFLFMCFYVCLCNCMRFVCLYLFECGCMIYVCLWLLFFIPLKSVSVLVCVFVCVRCQ